MTPGNGMWPVFTVAGPVNIGTQEYVERQVTRGDRKFLREVAASVNQWTLDTKTTFVALTKDGKNGTLLVVLIISSTHCLSSIWCPLVLPVAQAHSLSFGIR